MTFEDDFVLTKKNFSTMVESLVNKKRMPYLDAILDLCNERGIDPSDANGLLTNIVKEKLEVEAAKEGRLKVKHNSLPF